MHRLRWVRGGARLEAGRCVIRRLSEWSTQVVMRDSTRPVRAEIFMKHNQQGLVTKGLWGTRKKEERSMMLRFLA